MEIQRHDVESSNIKSIGYSEEKLEIEFKSGGVYRYDSVPKEIYVDMMKADSKGKYFHANIKDKFACSKIEDNKTEETKEAIEMEPSMIDKKKLITYSAKQTQLNNFKEELKELKNKFEEENEELISTISDLTETLDLNKSLLKEQAVDEFVATGSKQLLGGLGVRVSTVLDYEEKKAMDWAMKHQLCLQLNKKTFEALAKGDNESIDFVTKSEKVTITFPKEIKLEE